MAAANAVVEVVAAATTEACPVVVCADGAAVPVPFAASAVSPFLRGAQHRGVVAAPTLDSALVRHLFSWYEHYAQPGRAHAPACDAFALDFLQPSMLSDLAVRRAAVCCSFARWQGRFVC